MAGTFGIIGKAAPKYEFVETLLFTSDYGFCIGFIWSSPYSNCASPMTKYYTRFITPNDVFPILESPMLMVKTPF
jgi:hypothetical protein